MENNVKYTLALYNLNQKISELNIKISKDSNNAVLKKDLSMVLNDREILLKGTKLDEFEKILKKYGSKKDNE